MLPVLCRYRYAALPSKFTHLEERHLQPRTSLRLFQGSQLLTGPKLRLQQVLSARYGVPKELWQLLYWASNHGYSAESFHHLCDGYSPTFVIALVRAPFLVAPYIKVGSGFPVARLLAAVRCLVRIVILEL